MTQPTFGTAVIQELLEEVNSYVTPFGGTVDSNELLTIAKIHGFGFLTGIAAELANCAGEQMTMQAGEVADWEHDLIGCAAHCLLAILAARQISATVVADEPGAAPPVETGPVTAVFVADPAFAGFLAQIKSASGSAKPTHGGYPS